MTAMRLTASEQAAIREETGRCAPGATAYLFGSRTDDRRRGGDIDLLVFPCRMSLENRLRFRIALADRLGDQKIDLIVSADESDPLVRIARESGVRL
jgi:predicted nucleotidyltransferase